MIEQLPSAIHANHVCWYVTSKCNYACKYCYRYSTDDNITSFEEAKQIIDKLILLGANRITFTGEPLLVPWIPEAILYSVKSKLFTTVMTNGSLIDKEWLAFLLSSKVDRLSLPLDGSTEEINMQMSRPKDHFKKVDNIFSVLRDSGIILKATTVVSKINHGDLKNIATYLINAGVSEWKIYQFRSDHGVAAKNNKELFEISDSLFYSSTYNIRSFFSAPNRKFKMVSLKDRYFDFLQILSDGTLEMTTGNNYITLGNLKKDKPNLIHETYLMAINRLAKTNSELCKSI